MGAKIEYHWVERLRPHDHNPGAARGRGLKMCDFDLVRKPKCVLWREAGIHEGDRLC